MPRKKVPPTPVVDHAPAILVALAYLIGFITSYIAFELNDQVYVPDKLDRGPVAQRAVAYEAVKTVTTDEGLFISENGEERIISAALIDGELSLGYHRSIAAAEVSQNGEFIYYCAVMEDANSCLPFVYSRADDTVYPVTASDERLEVDLVTAGEAGWNTSRLHIDGMTSISASRPWEVR